MKIAELLARIGGGGGDEKAEMKEKMRTLEGEKEELARFDREITRRCTDLIKEMGRELERLGVPLFCSGVEFSVDEEVVRGWRARVVELLEDLCGDDNDGG